MAGRARSSKVLRALLVTLAVAGSVAACSDDGGQDGDGADAALDGDLGQADRGPDLPRPANDRCSAAQVVDLQQGKAVLVGTTGGATDEFAELACGLEAVWSAGQVYYRVSLPRGVHRVGVKPSGWDAALYAFPADTTCDETAINDACAGTAVDRSGIGVEEVIAVHATSAADWIIVIDGRSGGGPFTLAIEALAEPTGARCSAPATLHLSNGRATAQGTTAGAFDEFGTVDCGVSPDAFHGGQVYYSTTLGAETHYRVRLAAQADLALYAFPGSTDCSGTAVDQACTSPAGNPRRILASDNQNTGQEVLTISTGSSEEEWVIVVDSYGPSIFGSYQLTIESYTPAANGACAAPQLLTLGSAPLTVKGDNTGVDDELPAVDCGGIGPWPGGQLYYEVQLDQGKKYRVSASSAVFDLGLYALVKPAGCDAASINPGCTSPSGDPLNIWSSDRAGNVAEELLIAPSATSSWLVVVDSNGYFGAFELVIAEMALPTNTTCSAPQPLELNSSPVTVTGNTALPGVANEFGSAVSCGGAAGPWSGPQLYYRLDLEGGESYTITLDPEQWDAALYAFKSSTSCDAGAVDGACQGHASDDPGTGDETLTIAPTADEGWIVAVDSWLGGVGGAFDLEVSWQ